MVQDTQSTVRRSVAYTYLSALFVGSIVASNLMGTKIIPFFSIGSFEFAGSVGIFLLPLSFLATDIMAEIWGPKAARSLIAATIVILLIIMTVTGIATILPPADRFAQSNEAYNTIFRSSLRITFASIVAFTLSQTHDVWAFDLWKRVTNGKHLWLRNNLSTIVSQFIDTSVFMLIAFWGISEHFTLSYVMGSMLPPYWALKALMALLDTPFAYLGVKLIRILERPRGGSPETA